MVNFVIGPPCAGKSTFIKSTFHGAKIVDLWDYQKDLKFVNVDELLKTYEFAKEALLEAIADEEECVVFEHTLYKAARRAPYIEAVKNATSMPINCYVVYPDWEEYTKRCKKRKAMSNSLDYAMLDMPKHSEGFENIFIIK